MEYFVRRHGPWVATTIIGLCLLAAGLFFLVKGMSTRAEIRAGLADEQVYTSSDAPIPGVLVDSAELAQMQADVIKHHTLGTWGPYSQLDREDPRRASFIDGVSLRTALNLAVAGFGVADFAIAAGAIVLVAGFATLGLAAPALFMLAGVVVKQERGAPARQLATQS